MSKKDGFMIYGRIVATTTDQGLAGLEIVAMDKDLIKDDCLGTAKTDEQGFFEIKYSEKEFKKTFLEGRPDVYLQVYNQFGHLVWTSRNKVRYGAEAIENFEIKLDADALGRHQVENERLHFTNLLAVNPNYFGTAPGVLAQQFQAVNIFSGNKNYEELCGTGLYPEQNLLEAVIRIKRNYGYGSGLCGPGSTEYVAFYLDYGTGWEAAGTPAKVRVHNLQSALEGDIYYAARTSFSPKVLKKCSAPQILKMRAILSWNKEPNGPDFVPVYGQVVEEYVQIKPQSPTFVIPGIPDLIKPELIFPFPPELPSPPVVPPIPFPEYFKAPGLQLSGSLEEIANLVQHSIQIQKPQEVETERFDFLQIMQKNPNYFGSYSPEKDPVQIQQALMKLPAATLSSFVQIDPSLLIPVFPDNPKTKYEELTCVGLYPEEDLLEAIVRVKKENGYNGNLCSSGSREYVSFYIDYSDGAGYQLAGTTQVSVHDIERPDAQNPLAYAVRLKVNGLEERLKACTEEQAVRVKAILSWNVNPEPFGHTYIPAWGNVRIARVLIRPLSGPVTNARIEVVSGINIENIDQTGIGGAGNLGIGFARRNDAEAFDKPLGALIELRGQVNISGADYYRFMIKPFGAPDTAYEDLEAPFYYRVVSNVVFKRTPVVGKWFSIVQYLADTHPGLNPEAYKTALLHWPSGSRNGKYTLKLELANGSAPTPIPGQEAVVHLVIDNESIQLHEFGGTADTLPASGVVVKDSGGAFQKCGSFTAPDPIHVWGNFSHPYFSHYALNVFGGNIAAGGHTLVSDGGSYNDAADTSTGYTGTTVQGDGSAGVDLHAFSICDVPTAPSDTPHVNCAYGVQAMIHARTLRGSFNGITGLSVDTPRRQAFSTFNWDPAGAC